MLVGGSEKGTLLFFKDASSDLEREALANTDSFSVAKHFKVAS